MAIINNATSGDDSPDNVPSLEANQFYGFGIGSDQLTGGALSDVFFMSVDGNTDVINGGSGVDRVDYTNAGRALTVALDRGSTTARFLTGFEQGPFGLRPVYETRTVATLTSIEDVVGSAFGDSITGNSAGNMLDGGSGNDTLDGGAGNDLLVGGLGMDTIIGGTGSDTASYANASIGMHIRLDMPLFSSPGSPVLQGAARQITNPDGENGDLGLVDEDTLSGIENVVGSAFGDIIKSNGALNSINGGAGDDILQSFIDGQTDVMNGGQGEDTIDYSAFAQASGLTINLGQNGATGTAFTTSGAVEDTLTSIENVIGTSHGDRINGNELDNELNGGGGNDVIFGGGGRDQLWGGSGADRFVFTSVADFPAVGADQIWDFEHGSDLIDLSAIDANVNVAGNQAFTIVDEFTGVAGQLTVTENWRFQSWRGDINGDGQVDFRLDVLVESENGANAPFLTASDFIL